MSGPVRGALLLFLALGWAALDVAGQAETFRGYATAYTWPGEKNSQFAGGFNACQFGRLSPYFETYFAALNVAQYKQGLCGRCAAVRGTGARATGKIVVVMIVDACATCAYGDLDFTTRGSNDITGYSFDHQPIEWWWTSCDNPVPPRWPYFDVAGGMEIVNKARSQGYNVNLAMMRADLTLTGGVVPYPAVQAAAAQTTASQAIAQAQAARGAANAASNRARQLQGAAAAAWAKVARLQAAATAINGTAKPEAKKAAIDAANAAYAAAQAARNAAMQAVTAARDAGARAAAATSRAMQARQQAAAAAAADRRRQQAAAAAAAQRAAEDRRRAIAAMQAAAAAAAAQRNQAKPPPRPPRPRPPRPPAPRPPSPPPSPPLPPSPPSPPPSPPLPPWPPMRPEELQRLLKAKQERQAGAEWARRNTPQGAPYPPSPPALPRLEAYLQAQLLGPESAPPPSPLPPAVSPSPPPSPRPPPPPGPPPPQPSPPPSPDLQPRGLVLAPPTGAQEQAVAAAAALPGRQQALPQGMPIVPGQPLEPQSGQGATQQPQA